MEAVETKDWQQYLENKKGKHGDTATKLQGIIDWIADYALDNGYMPKRKEIADGLFMDMSVLSAHLKEAQGLGLIDWLPYQERTFMIKGLYYVIS